jgi:threonine/homoserine/homoserine lactone efflux protein
VTGEADLFLVGLAVGVPLALAPGAVVVRTIHAVPEHGIRAGIRAAGGRFFADLLAIGLLSIVALSPPEILVRDGRPGTVIGIAGGIVLLVIGFRLMDRRIVGALSRDQGSGGTPAVHGNPVVDRFVATIASPWWHLFWWTAGLCVLLRAAGPGISGIGIFAATFLVPGLLWPTFVAVRLSEPERETAITDRQYRILTSVGGLILVGTGFFFGGTALSGSGIHEMLERVVANWFG